MAFNMAPTTGANPFSSLVWFRKMVEIRHLTEEGAYAEDQVPDDYGGAELKVELIQYVIFTDNAGTLTMLNLTNIKDVMDKDREKGVGVTVEWLPAFEAGQIIPDATLIVPAGPSAHSVTWREVENEDLTDVLLNRARQIYLHYDKQMNPEDYGIVQKDFSF